MQKKATGMHRLIRGAMTAYLIISSGIPAAVAMQPADQSFNQAEAQARTQWRENVTHLVPSAAGCFQASYPSILWRKLACKAPGYRRQSVPLADHRLNQSSAESRLASLDTGNTYDYAIQTSHLISTTTGSFPSVAGVATEKSSTGIAGSNEYMLQINTNWDQSTAACNNHSGCRVWQQYMYATDYTTDSQGNPAAAVFIQYWLENYGDPCPTASVGAAHIWVHPSDDSSTCYMDSAYTVAPDVPISQLGTFSLTGTATTGGNDTVTFTYNDTNGHSQAYALSGASDSVLDIASVWNTSEFNIVGDTSGAKAQFNSGSSIKVQVGINDGSTDTPKCIGPDDGGTTGETNNLTLGNNCSATGAPAPFIQFTESN